MEYPPNYGIDTSEAGTSQERYFMVLAGLLYKNLLVQTEIRDALLAQKATPKADVPVLPREIPEPELDFMPETRRPGKKTQR